MANNKMLIDASHPEETRVAVVRGNRIEEFDYESQQKAQIRGNIYLAKVTRVEPSLQAAFVDYGGNRHGFLAFSEIHPDYYQIPYADRQALLAEEAAESRAAAQSEDEYDAAIEQGRHSDHDYGQAEGVTEVENNGDFVQERHEIADEAESEQSAQAETVDEGDEAAPKARPSRRKAAAKSTKPAAKPKGEGRAKGKKTSAKSAEQSDEDASGVSLEDASGDASSEESENTPAMSVADSDPGEDDGGSRSMAAANEGDSISEPASSPDDDDNDGESDGDGEIAAESKAKPARRRATRRSPKPVAEAETDIAIEAASAESSEDADGESDEASEDEVEMAGASASASGNRRRSRRSRRGASHDQDGAARQASDGDDHNGRRNDRSNDRSGGRSGGRMKEMHGEGEEQVESVGQEDAMEEVPTRRKSRRQYKIQEVIKRRQVLLVQVVKEERGNKGAALTTYLSLAGRYSVLMPNTARGGGISRKITNAPDRKRLKAIASELAVPEGMGVILRTAGASRTKADINRDFDYLMRLWENVRNLTLSSTAPCLVYEEGSLIKRSIRDLYNKEIVEVVVAGEAGYREAKEFMRMLMPSHAKHVKLHREDQPLFASYGVEAQLDKMMTPQVSLKSGGYLVINQTEALVAIDVNSGRSTREHSIEETALATNLEAAEEVARQLRLRDLAGLIVIDFIDMEENRNNRAVEKRLKDSLKHDRARIQVGRISHFGLLEMSRQRMRSSVLESTMDVCPHCAGAGLVRSESGMALHVVRAIEDHLMRHSRFEAIIKTSQTIALQILNNKRQTLVELEERFGTRIIFKENTTNFGQEFTIEKGEPSKGEPKRHIIQSDTLLFDEEDDGTSAWDEDAISEASSHMEGGDDDHGDDADAGGYGNHDSGRSESRDDGRRGNKRKRRRRGKRNREDGPAGQFAVDADRQSSNRSGDDDGYDDHSIDPSGDSSGEMDGEGSLTSSAHNGGDDERDPRRKRRRGKRGGRRNRNRNPEDGEFVAGSDESGEDREFSETHDDEPEDSGHQRHSTMAENHRDESRQDAVHAPAAEAASAPSRETVEASEPGDNNDDDEAALARGRNTRRKSSNGEVEVKVISAAPQEEVKQPKKGWWNRGFFS